MDLGDESNSSLLQFALIVVTSERFTLPHFAYPCVHLSERCSDSLPALLRMCTSTHGCTKTVVKLSKQTWFSCKGNGREIYNAHESEVSTCLEGFKAHLSFVLVFPLSQCCIFMGGTGLKVWILKGAQSHSKCSSTPFLLLCRRNLNPEIWL